MAVPTYYRMDVSLLLDREGDGGEDRVGVLAGDPPARPRDDDDRVHPFHHGDTVWYLLPGEGQK